MKLDSFTYNDKKYDFRLTMAAKAEIEELQFKVFDNLEDPEVLNIMNEMTELQQKLAEANKKKDEDETKDKSEEEIKAIKEQINAVSFKIMPKMKSFLKLQQNTIDPVEIAEILLLNDRRYKDEMSKALAEEIMFAMEDEMDDFAKYSERLAGIAEKVFTMIGLAQDRLVAIANKKETKETVVKDKKLLS